MNAPQLAFGPHGPLAVPTTSARGDSPGGEPPWADPLDRDEWIVRPIPHAEARAFISEHHYAGGASNTSVARFGLYHREGSDLLGAAIYLPPPGQAARSVRPAAPRRVLALSRLAIAPGAPRNAASFLISSTVRLLPDGYDTIATWADTARGHVGTIYQAASWRYLGVTRPAPMYRAEDGRMVSRKRGPKTYTHSEMLEAGNRLVGRFVRHKYLLDRRAPQARLERPYPKREARLFAAP